MKLGKRPATHDARDLQLAHYLAPDLPTPPASFGHDQALPPDGWGMLGNDRYGDCVFAGADHETMLWNAEHGQLVEFSEACALADYAAVTGFDPQTGAGDNGTDVRQALGYRRKTGLRDAKGARHRIGAYVALEPGNWEHLLIALYLFGAVGIGFEFPTSAMAQFDASRPWSLVHGAKTDGGHYVPLVAVRHRHLVCVTWGRTQQMTKGFFERYCDEAWALLSHEALDGQGHSLEGFDLAQLTADLGKL